MDTAVTITNPSDLSDRDWVRFAHWSICTKDIPTAPKCRFPDAGSLTRAQWNDLLQHRDAAEAFAFEVGEQTLATMIAGYWRGIRGTSPTLFVTDETVAVLAEVREETWAPEQAPGVDGG